MVFYNFLDVCSYFAEVSLCSVNARFQGFDLIPDTFSVFVNSFKYLVEPLCELLVFGIKQLMFLKHHFLLSLNTCGHIFDFALYFTQVHSVSVNLVSIIDELFVVKTLRLL